MFALGMYVVSQSLPVDYAGFWRPTLRAPFLAVLFTVYKTKPFVMFTTPNYT